MLSVFGLPGGFEQLSPTRAGIALGVAFGLGWLGAWLAVTRHLVPAEAPAMRRNFGAA
jgi:hypothetical protein